MKTKFTTMAIAAGLAAIASVAQAAASRDDTEFMTKAAAGGMYEVEAGKLAESRGTSPEVKSYGSMLIKDHSAAGDELKGLASKKGVALPATLPEKFQKKLEKLSKEKNFDKEFVKEVGLDDHKDDIKMFEKTSKKADDADVKAFATKTLPTLKMHREHAEMLRKSIK